MRIAIGCDHIVTDIKNEVRDYLISKGYDVIDLGTYDNQRTHYPIYGKKVADAVVQKQVDCGVVICGTGVGITNAVNKVKGARCALVGDVATARYVKTKLNANVIGFGGRVSGIGLLIDMLDTFIESTFEDTEENNRLIKKIDEVMKMNENDYDDNFFDEFLDKWNNGEYND